MGDYFYEVIIADLEKQLEAKDKKIEELEEQIKNLKTNEMNRYEEIKTAVRKTMDRLRQYTNRS